MAANFADRVVASAPIMTLVGRIRGIQGYNILREVPFGNGGVEFELTHTLSFSSWGENILIHLLPYNGTQTMIDIKSECSLPTQLVDWGKNKKNVVTIMNYLLNGIMVSRI